MEKYTNYDYKYVEILNNLFIILLAPKQKIIYERGQEYISS